MLFSRIVRFGVTAAALMAALGSSGLARADDSDGLPDVADRYEGTGAHVGSFWLLPTLETGGFYDSNVNASSNNPKGSFGAYIAPEIKLESDWGRHALNVDVAAKQDLYSDAPDQDRTELRGTIESQIDIQRDLVLVTGIKGGLFEDRTGTLGNALLADEPTRHRDFTGYASLNKAFNRLSVSVGAAYSLTDYDDVSAIGGGSIDQDFRDGDTTDVKSRVAYEISPGYSLFTELAYNWRSYDNAGSGSSEGWRSLTGVEFEVSRLIRGEVGVGYMAQDYDGGPDEGTFSYHAGLIWNPTPLMTVNLTADRQVKDSAVAGSAGYVSDAAALRVDYEVLRGTVLSPMASVSRIDYIGSPEQGFEYMVGVELDRSINRFLSLGLHYEYTSSEIENAAPGVGDYDRHLIAAYAKARF